MSSTPSNPANAARRLMDGVYTTLAWRDGTIFIEGVVQRALGRTGDGALQGVIHLLDTRGPTALAEVEGDFIALVLTQNEVSAFKSFTSQYQLYYRPEDGLVTNRLYMLWEPDCVWDEDYFARHCFLMPGSQYMGTQTPLAGVNRVLPGELVTLAPCRIKRQQCVQRNYSYNLNPAQTREDQAPAIANLMRDAVVTRLQARPGASACIEMSGHTDTASLACLLAEAGVRNIRGVMFSQPRADDHADREQRARDVATYYGIDLVIVPPQEQTRRLAEVTRYSDEPAHDLGTGDLRSRKLAELADPGSWIFTNHGADQLFARSTAFLPYLLGRGQLGAWRETLPHASEMLCKGQLHLSWQCLLSQIPSAWHRALLNNPILPAMNLLDVSDVNAERMRLGEVGWLRAGRGLATYMHERYQAERHLVGTGILCNDWGYFAAPRTTTQTLFEAKGLVDATPFRDLSVVDHMYQEVSALLVHDFKSPNKALLRDVQRQIVPQSLRSRDSSEPNPTRWLRSQTPNSRERFEALLAGADPHWIDRGAARAALNTVPFGKSVQENRSIMALLGYLQWQQNFAQQAACLQRNPEDACRLYRTGGGLGACSDPSICANAA